MSNKDLKEYELELKVKNAALLNLMRCNGLNTAADLSRETGVSQSELGKYLNLLLSPYDSRFNPRKSAVILSEFFNVSVDMLVPFEELYDPLVKNKFIKQVNKEDLLRIDGGECPSVLLEHLENESDEPFNGMLLGSSVTERESLVLSLRYEQDMTFKEIGKKLGVTQSRVSQMLWKAEGKIRRDHGSGRIDLSSSAGKYSSLYKELEQK